MSGVESLLQSSPRSSSTANEVRCARTLSMPGRCRGRGCRWSCRPKQAEYSSFGTGCTHFSGAGTGAGSRVGAGRRRDRSAGQNRSAGPEHEANRGAGPGRSRAAKPERTAGPRRGTRVGADRGGPGRTGAQCGAGGPGWHRHRRGVKAAGTGAESKLPVRTQRQSRRSGVRTAGPGAEVSKPRPQSRLSLAKRSSSVRRPSVSKSTTSRGSAPEVSTSRTTPRPNLACSTRSPTA